MIVVSVRLFSNFQQGRGSVVNVKFPSSARVEDLLKELKIDVAEVEVKVVQDRSTTLRGKLKNGDSVTLIPAIGGG